MRSFLRTHPIGSGLGGLALLAALAWLAFGFFGVHTLFIDDVVDEAGPVFDADPVAAQTTADEPTPPTVDEPDGPAASQPTGDATTPPAVPTPSATTPPTVTTPPVTTPPVTTAPTVPEIVTEFTGTFVDKAHPTDGSASVLGNGSGQRFVRFENFETDNGPDLNVYLVNSSTGDVSDYVDLGDLKGNIGDQNYEVPADVDLSVYDTVVIWCVRFSVSFGEATLVGA